MARFSLSKWYMDCITDSGDISIAYTGTINWRRAHLSYSTILESVSGRLTTNHSTRKPEKPEIHGDSVSWSSKPLHVQASWQALSPGLRETIFRCDDGSVEWHCSAPCAQAQFRGRCGLGYVDRITMTLPPWKLPIQYLRWGHFASQADWVVWIDWQGEFCRKLVFLNGKSAN